ncbi:MAG TPA: AAA family ATPase, partial [Nitriliruptoraceae bacterium]|nr:AAA family ATPase [Nitriliruptoraceae bacterium]
RVESDAGNTAAALQVYEQCRSRLTEDLGVDTSSDTQGLHAAILRAIPDPSATTEPAIARSLGGADITHPFVGLRAFTQDDSHLFFGRDAAVHHLVELVERHDSLVVVGPSGSGKSSLVRAGLLPALAKGAIPDADTWPAIVMTPGHAPLQALARAMIAEAAVDPSADALADLAERLGAAPADLPDLVRDLVPGVGADHAGEPSRLVIVVDQAEELFTLSPPDEAASLLQAVTSKLDHQGSLVVPVFTLRSDFYTEATADPAMVRLLTGSQYVVMPMAGHELEGAIIGPVRTVGGAFGPGVLGRVMAAHGDSPTGLPLLQFALARMWEHRDGVVVDMAALDEVGGVTGAVAAAAESAVDDLDPAAMAAIRRLLLRLVVVADNSVTRRREDTEDLCASSGVDRSMVDRLVDARLLSSGRDAGTGRATVELAHEAIVEAWPRLHDWILSAREQLIEAQRLRTEAAAWDARGRHPDHLWAGARLDDARSLITADDVVSLSPVERDFVKASTAAARDRDVAIAQQESVAASAAQFRRQARWIGAVMAGVMAAAVAVGIVLQREAAADRETAARAELIATASGTVTTRPDLGLLLAVEAWQRNPGPAEQRVLLDGLRTFDGVADTWAGARHDTGTSDSTCVTFPEPGTVVLQPSTDPDRGLASTPGTVLEVDLEERSVVRRLDTTLNCKVHRSPAGVDPVMFVGTDVAETAVTVFSADGAAVHEFPGLTQPLFVADGTILARPEGGDVTSWVVVDPATGSTSPSGMRAVRVDPIPGGPLLWVATAVQPGTAAGWPEVSLVDATTREPMTKLVEVLGGRLVEPMAASSGDGGIVAVATLDGAVAVIDTSDDSLVADIPDLSPTALALDERGERLYSIGQENVLAIHEVDTGRLMGELPIGPDLVM